MRIEDLEYFLQVTRAGAISKAAQQLGIAQPSLSKAISRLEGELKTQLFERHAAGVRLTAAGRVFLTHAQRIALHAADAAVALREIRQGARGLVRVGLGVGVPARILTSTCTQVLERGAVNFHVRGGMSDSLLLDLANGELDVVVAGVPQPMDQELSWEPLWSDPMVPMLPRTHALARRRAVMELRELLDQRWVLPTHGTVTRKRFDGVFINAGLDPPEATIDSRASGREYELALALGAIALMPRSVLADSRVLATMLPMRAPQALTIDRTVAVLSRRRQDRSPVVEKFISYLRKNARQMSST